MAKRRRKGSGFPWAAVLALVVLGAAGYAGWRWLAQQPETAPAVATGGTSVVELPQPGQLAVCGLAPAAAVESALGAAVAAPGGAAAGVPSAGSCTWTTKDGGLVSALVFTRASLERGANPLHGRAYFDSVATGLEYAFKETPQSVSGVGDAAVAGGFDAGAGQVVVLKGDTVLHVTSARVERGAVEKLAGAVAEKL